MNNIPSALIFTNFIFRNINIDNINQGNITPVSEEFINNLQTEEVTEDMTNIECPICLDKFKMNDKYISLPCKHCYHCEHDNCRGIHEWLKRNNTCPVCREILPSGNLQDDNNINNINNTIDTIIESMINDINNINNENNDLQRAIEISLNDL